MKKSMREVAGTTYAAQKQDLYRKVRDLVRHHSGGARINLDQARDVAELVLEQALAAAARDGSFRLHDGLGHLKVRVRPAGRRQLPGGELVEYPAKRVLSFDQGLTGEALVECRGDLRAAWKERGKDRRGLRWFSVYDQASDTDPEDWD